MKTNKTKVAKSKKVAPTRSQKRRQRKEAGTKQVFAKAREIKKNIHAAAEEIANSPAGDPNLVAAEIKPEAPKTSRTCADCGIAVPPRYIVCDECLEKRREARKAAKAAPAPAAV